MFKRPIRKAVSLNSKLIEGILTDSTVWYSTLSLDFVGRAESPTHDRKERHFIHSQVLATFYNIMNYCEETRRNSQTFFRIYSDYISQLEMPVIGNEWSLTIRKEDLDFKYDPDFEFFEVKFRTLTNYSMYPFSVEIR